jgi:hypothetical protein
MNDDWREYFGDAELENAFEKIQLGEEIEDKD